MPCNSPPLGNQLEFMELIGMINKKWTIVTIVTMGNYDGVRFNHLRRDIDGASSKTLSKTLCDLCKLGIAKTEKTLGPPTIYEYHLTEKGKKLREMLIPAVGWVLDNSNYCDSKGVLLALSHNDS